MENSGCYGEFRFCDNHKKKFLFEHILSEKRREGGQGRFVQRGQIFEVLRTWEIHSSVSSYIAKFQECGEGPPIFFLICWISEKTGGREEKDS